MEKMVSIQVHLDKLLSVSTENLKTVLHGFFHSIGDHSSCSLISFVLDEEEGHATATFSTDEVPQFWDWIRSKLTLGEHFGFHQASLVVCEGEQGWEDHLLLYSFDPMDKIDQLRPRTLVDPELDEMAEKFLHKKFGNFEVFPID